MTVVRMNRSAVNALVALRKNIHHNAMLEMTALLSQDVPKDFPLRLGRFESMKEVMEMIDDMIGLGKDE